MRVCELQEASGKEEVVWFTYKYCMTSFFKDLRLLNKERLS
jgi:hypothetical protein